MKKRSFAIAAEILIVAALVTGCGSYEKSMGAAADNSSSYYSESPQSVPQMRDMAAVTEEAVEYESDDYAEAAGGAQQPGESLQQSQRKLIKTVDMDVQTEGYDTLIAGLEKQITELGGYIEYQYQYNGNYYNNDALRNANLQIRIPSDRLDEFIDKVGEQSNVTNKEVRVEDVTLRYVDLESHKTALLTEQSRLLDLLEVAETVEDIITIEQRLSDVRYQLESMESQLRTLDNQIDYSTINLRIQEVRRVTPTEEKTVWDKIRNGFSGSIYNIGDGLVNFFIWFVVNIPYIVIWAVIIGAVFFIIRAIIKKKRRKNAAMIQSYMAAQPNGSGVQNQNTENK